MNNKSLYQARKIFYTDPVNGKFNRIRLITMSFVVFCFFLLPWVSFNNTQAFLFDAVGNKFYIFGVVFWPQDFVLLALFGIFSVIALFVATVYSGRIWCGFLCPQSIWIKMAAFITRFFEGFRNNRLKLDKSEFSLKKIRIKFLKHFFLLFLSFLTAFTFIGYFVPIKLLFFSFMKFDIFYYSFFWILFFSFLTYFNIDWFKEQFCFLVCPYARLQSVMFDENTLIVSYDRVRGERRGSRSRDTSYKDLGLGDCIDCKKCVTCCPTGIDIRDGLQMECISCGACIDACNSVMDKLGYKKDLISFKRESLNKFRYSYVKMFLYTFVLFILFSFILYFLINRSSIGVSVIRNQHQLFNITKDNFIENFFLFKIINKSNNDSSFRVFVEPDFFEIDRHDDFFLKNGERMDINIILRTRREFLNSKSINITFSILNLKSNECIKKKIFFVFPGE